MEKKKILFIVKLVSSLLTVITGILLVSGLSELYFGAKEGEDVYTSASILSKQAYWITSFVFFMVTLLLSIFASIFLPKEREKGIKREKEDFLKQLKSLKDDSPLREEQKKTYHDSKRKKRIYRITFSVLSLILLVFPSAYLFNPNHFSAYGSLREEAVALAIHTLPFLLGIYILALIYSFLKDKEDQKEIDLFLSLPLKKGREVIDRKKEEKIKFALQLTILAVAIVFIIVGAVNGEAEVVLAKAINICTECIGLG